MVSEHCRLRTTVTPETLVRASEYFFLFLKRAKLRISEKTLLRKKIPQQVAILVSRILQMFISRYVLRIRKI